jgi:hypothetical protein
MPGAPNRPPEIAAAPAPPPTVDPPEAKLLRRLVPSHVALLQETWKGGAPPEVLAPFEKAEVALRASDFAGAGLALDQLSIRFAEPRWPSLAEPYRRLRVPIPAPTPPQWDPDHGVAADEKEARKARRVAEEQLALASACVGWAGTHGVPASDLAGPVESARAALAGPGVPPDFYASIDRIWRELRGRLPAPQRAGKPVAAAAADES